MTKFVVFPVGIILVVLFAAAVTREPLVALAVVALVAFTLLPKSLVIPTAACAIIALMVVFPVQYLKDYGGLARAILFITPVLTLAAFVRAPQALRPARRSVFLLFGGYGFLLAVSTLSHPGTANADLLWSALFPALCLTALLVAAREEQRRVVEAFVVGLAGIQALYAIVETSVGLVPLWTSATTDRASQIIPGLIRAQGTFAHPLPLALFCIVALGILLRHRHRVRPLTTVTLSLILTVGLVATGSRSALLITAVLFGLSFGRRAWTVTTVAVLSAGIGLTALASLGFFRSASFLNFVGGDSLSHRSGAFSALPRLIGGQDTLSLLFGNGYFSAPFLFTKGLLQGGSFYAIDNQLVSSLVETGLLGVLLMIALCVVAFWFAGPYKLLVFAAVAFFFTFDLLDWPSAATLFALAVSMAGADRSLPGRVRDGARRGVEDRLAPSVPLVDPAALNNRERLDDLTVR